MKSAAAFHTEETQIVASVEPQEDGGVSLSLIEIPKPKPGEKPSYRGLVNLSSSRGGPEGVCLRFHPSMGTTPLNALFLALSDLLYRGGVAGHPSLRVNRFLVEWLFEHHRPVFGVGWLPFKGPEKKVMVENWKSAYNFAKDLLFNRMTDEVLVNIIHGESCEWPVVFTLEDNTIRIAYLEEEQMILEALAHRAALLADRAFDDADPAEIRKDIRVLTMMLDVFHKSPPSTV